MSFFSEFAINLIKYSVAERLTKEERAVQDLLDKQEEAIYGYSK